jgi:hypothetical protein
MLDFNDYAWNVNADFANDLPKNSIIKFYIIGNNADWENIQVYFHDDLNIPHLCFIPFLFSKAPVYFGCDSVALIDGLSVKNFRQIFHQPISVVLFNSDPLGSISQGCLDLVHCPTQGITLAFCKVTYKTIIF